MQTIQLPAAQPLSMPLSEVIAKRRSCRVFSEERLTAQEWSNLLAAALGITDANGHRATPSARDCREIVGFLVNETGVWKYDETQGTLTQTREGDVRGETTLMQDFVKTAPVTLVFAVDAKRCGGLVGDRAERCMHIDAGCALLASHYAATAMGLQSVVRASFDVEKVRGLLNCGPDFTPIILLTVGHAA